MGYPYIESMFLIIANKIICLISKEKVKWQYQRRKLLNLKKICVVLMPQLQHQAFRYAPNVRNPSCLIVSAHTVEPTRVKKLSLVTKFEPVEY
jgi:hypothetical protein